MFKKILFPVGCGSNKSVSNFPTPAPTLPPSCRLYVQALRLSRERLVECLTSERRKTKNPGCTMTAHQGDDSSRKKTCSQGFTYNTRTFFYVRYLITWINIINYLQQLLTATTLLVSQFPLLDTGDLIIPRISALKRQARHYILFFFFYKRVSPSSVNLAECDFPQLILSKVQKDR